MPNKSRIEEIKIPIPNYIRPGSIKDVYPYFVGRHNIFNKIKDLLSGTNELGGVYLLVGARGMGKTTLVNKVLTDINPKEEKRNSEKKTRYEKIEISLSNENFEEIDVY